MTVRLTAPRQQVEHSIKEAVDQGANLLSRPHDDDVEILLAGYQTWDKRNQIILDSLFETSSFFSSGPKHDYADMRGLAFPFVHLDAEAVTIEGIRGDIETKLRRLREVQQNLDIYPSPAPGPTPEDDRSSGLGSIFIIHGRSEVPRLKVQNFLLKATTHEPVVLMEQSNRGATIIEKLEEHLGEHAGFAVVLLTGDDEGRLRGTTDLMSRARQNVILELGYAMGRLGRRNVTLLYEEGVDLPSDINGVAYYALDAHGGWQRHLLGDLKAAGFEVSAEALLS